MNAAILPLFAAAASFLIPSQTPRFDPSAKPPPSADPIPVLGELVPASDIGPQWVEGLDEVMARDRATPPLDGVHYRGKPKNPHKVGLAEAKAAAALEPPTQLLGGGGTPPTLSTNFVGPRIGDAGGAWIPPDTCGSVGMSHFVSIVNANVSAWNKTTGARVMNVGEAAFFNSAQSLGDGRVVYDPHSGRFIALGTSFSNGARIYIAVSSTGDPTGTWFKTFFTTNGGSDAGTWPDYPTLGVDANGIYICVYAVGTDNQMTIFAIDKAPLVAPVQSMGTLTAFRDRPWEGAIQPCVTYGNPGGEYLITYSQIYRVNPPMNAPTLSVLGTADLPSWSSPPDAPNQGGGGLDSLDGRLMNAVWRNGRIWTTHAVGVGGRSAIRWYEIDPTLPLTSRCVQNGQIDDPVRHYLAPGISVNVNNAMIVGFSGSSGSQFAAAYVAGRKPTDAANQTCVPIQIKAGESSYNDGRWGDYALTSIDPENDLDFWSIVEYARGGGQWGTWIAETIYDTCAPIAPSIFCQAAANSYTPTGANMSSAGTNSIGQNNFELITYGVPPNKTCMYLYAQDQSAFVVFGNGFRCIDSPLFRVKPATTSNLLGDVSYPLDLNTLPVAGTITAGSSWGFMLWYRDPQAGGALFNGSDALSTFWCP